MAPTSSFVPIEVSPHALRLLNESLSHIPHAFFQIAASMLYVSLRGCMFCYLFKGGDSVSSSPPGSPKAEPTDFSSSRC